MSRSMKDSDVAWIGEIPESWEMAINKMVFQNVSKKNHPAAEVLSLYRDWGIVPKNSRDDNFNVTSEKTEQYKFVEIGDLVINKMKAWQGSLAVSEYEGIVSPAYYVCKFRNEKMNKKYVHHLLRSSVYAQQWECLSTGMRVGQWDLSIDDFLTSPLLMPPIEEQQRIVEMLDKKCSQIDTLISNQQRQIEKLKQYKQSLITEVVTKGLNPDAEMKDSGVEWIGEIPSEWSVDKCFRIFEMIGSGTTPKGELYFDNGTINWMQSGDINGGILDSVTHQILANALENFSALTIYTAPYIVIAMYGASVGNISLSKIDACVNQACCVLGNTKENMKFMFYALMAAKSFLLRSAVGGGQPNISQAILKKLWLPKPNMITQIEIVNYLEQKCSKIDSLIAIKQQKIEKLDQYKKSVIYEYVTGKKEV